MGNKHGDSQLGNCLGRIIRVCQMIWFTQKESTVLLAFLVIKLKLFPRYWPFVRGIHRSPVNSLHKDHWHGAFMFSLICARINGWTNNGDAGDHCNVQKGPLLFHTDLSSRRNVGDINHCQYLRYHLIRNDETRYGFIFYKLFYDYMWPYEGINESITIQTIGSLHIWWHLNTSTWNAVRCA